MCTPLLLLKNGARIGPNVQAGRVEIGLQELVLCPRGSNRRSGVLPTVDAKLFHPGQQSRAILAQASGGSVRAAHAALRFGECAHYRVALISRIFLSNAGFITRRICPFPSDLPGFTQVSRRGRFCLRFLEFCEWSLKRPTPCENHRTLNEILQFTNVPGPVPLSQAFHDSRRNTVNFLLHLFCESFDEITYQQRNIFSALPQRRYPDWKHIQP